MYLYSVTLKVDSIIFNYSYQQICPMQLIIYSILENQSRMLARLTTSEEHIEKFKVDISVLKPKQSDLDSKVNAMSKEISLKCDHGKDLQFVIDRHEQ